MYSAIELQRYELVHIPAKFLLIFFLWFLEISPSPVAGEPAGCLSGDGWQKQPDGRKCQNFLETFQRFCNPLVFIGPRMRSNRSGASEF